MSDIFCPKIFVLSTLSTRVSPPQICSPYPLVRDSIAATPLVASSFRRTTPPDVPSFTKVSPNEEEFLLRPFPINLHVGRPSPLYVFLNYEFFPPWVLCPQTGRGIKIVSAAFSLFSAANRRPSSIPPSPPHHCCEGRRLVKSS